MFDNACIVCDCTENLNTSMTVAIDGAQVSVRVCDAHAEDITPKQVREAYLTKKARIDKVIEEARKLGLEIGPSTTTSKLVVAKSVQRQAQPQQELEPITESGGEAALVPAEDVDRRFSSIQGVAGAITGTSMSAEKHAGYNLDSLEEQLPPEARKGQARLEAVYTSDGRPMAIPTLRKDGTGTTVIRIAQTDDAAIQRRLKQMADATRANPTVHDPNYHSFKQGYAVRDCPLCRGAGSLRKSKTQMIVCTRCGGRGMVDQ